MNTTVFFTTGKGITSTSASTIANFANEKRVAIEAALAKVHFYNVYKDMIGTNSSDKLVKTGYAEEKTKSLVDLANKSAQLCALNAWLREAVKAKEQLLKEADKAMPDIKSPVQPHSVQYPSRLSRVEYFHEILRIEVPSKPQGKTATEEEIIAEFTPAEYAEFIGCNSKSAVYGQLAHSEGALNKARKELHEACEEPYVVENTLIEHRVPTVSTEVVNSVFTEFQKKQRSYNAEYNAWKNRIKKAVLERQHQYDTELIAENEAYRKLMAEIDSKIEEKYQQDMAIAYAEEQEHDQKYDEWVTARTEYEQRILTFRKEEQERIASLKILIPDSLQAIFTELDNELRSK